MKLAIMQPYIFPYIGYFQLINAVDKFVIYDDVNFIKQGWINRNNILVQGKPLFFTIPLQNQSSFIKINQVFINEKAYVSWLPKFLKTLEQSYKKAPYFDQIFNLVSSTLAGDFNQITISTLARRSIESVLVYLGITTEIVTTSAIYCNSELSGKKRVIDICKEENATHYINPIGGQELYDSHTFEDNSLALSFIKSLPIQYSQINDTFIPWLSIIDVLMHNSIDDVKIMLTKFELI
jgi:hypothetical protein